VNTSRHAIVESIDHAEATTANAEFEAELPAFCKLMGVSPAVLKALPIPTLQLLITMRVFKMIKMLSAKIRDLDARTAVPSLSPSSSTEPLQ
jgi:hypothetical protein